MASSALKTRREMYAEQTRQDIYAAARQLFAAQGYAQTRVEDIAKAAGVATITVYSAVGGKAGILRMLMEVWSTTPRNEQLLQQVLAQKDPRSAIATVAGGVRALRQEFGDIAYFMQDAAPHDADVQKSLETATKRYRAWFVTVAEHLMAAQSLRPELTVQDAAEILWFYFGYWGYYTLHNENGWTYERAQDWLTETSCHALLHDAAQAASQ